MTPSLVDRMFTEAVDRQRLERTAEAEALYRAILAIQPTHAEACYKIGVICHRRRQVAEAEGLYRRAIAMRHDYAEAHTNLGSLLLDLGRTEEAVAGYRQAITIKPDFALAHCNLGAALKVLGRFGEAEAACRQAIALKPDFDWAYATLGAARLEQDRVEEAIAVCRQAVAISPALAMAHYNMAVGLRALNRAGEAIAACRQAIAVQPDYAEAHFGVAQCLLLSGDLEAGWRHYEWRWKLKEYGWLQNLHGSFTQPRWDGGDFCGKTLLIYAEQGIGDALQYVRYLPTVVARGGRVVLAVHPPVMRLLGQFEGVTVVDVFTPPLPLFDLHCPLLSLPGLFGTRLESIPAGIPYLKADPGEITRWGARLGEKKRLRVGVVWAGNPAQKGDRLRSPRLAAMAPLLLEPGIDFVGLQVGPGRDDLAVNPLPARVLDLGAEVCDFADTAGILAHLDLLITSCTAPLHLAGAMGVPVWAVVPFAPHFPWMLDRPDSPWYPSLRLYRQEQPGTQWSGVVARVIEDVRKLAAAGYP